MSYVSRLLQGLAFAWQQAVGLPGGPHAAFKRYMADAATLRLVQRVRTVDEGSNKDMYSDLRTTGC